MAVCAAGWRMSDDTRDLAQRITGRVLGMRDYTLPDERIALRVTVEFTGDADTVVDMRNLMVDFYADRSDVIIAKVKHERR